MWVNLVQKIEIAFDPMVPNLRTLATFAAGAAGVFAAAFWYIASKAEVAHDPHRRGDKSAVVFMNGEHKWDVIRTAELQTKWNKRAALFASVAATLQAVSLVLPEK